MPNPLEKKIERLRASAERGIENITRSHNALLAEQLRYAALNGGKRLRPIFVMLCCELAGGKPAQAVMPAAAIELLHTFTLVHDDIMDNADSRRGIPTIHKKWNTSIAILAGDQLMAIAYNALLRTNATTIPEMFRTFTQGFYEVCEGQAYDNNFETRTSVTPKEYIAMIEMKTSSLFKTSAVLGGLSAGVEKKERSALSTFGKNIGIAFQIQDDYLDNFGGSSFGKKIGGDILEGKRTFFLVGAMEKAANDTLINKLIQRNITQKEVPSVITRFEQLGLKDEAERLVHRYTNKAIASLEAFPDSTAKRQLMAFALGLVGRTK